MVEIYRCPECNVPEPFYQGQTWLNNGDIVQRANPGARIALIECEILDPLFGYIGDIIGMPIDRIIINITARATKLYISHLIPHEIKEMVRARQIGLNSFIDSITTYCEIVGYGKYEFMDYRFENDADDYAILRIMEPFSVTEAAGAFTGALSAVVGGEHDVHYEEIWPGLFEFTSSWTKYPEVFKEKMKIHQYNHVEGDLELQKCSTCGSPKALSGFDWQPERGVILNRLTGRRMALLGPELLDPIFKALETELGETIPEVVVEAQRRFIRTGFHSINIMESQEKLRSQLALRGFGNLREMSISRRGAYMRMDNACLYLMLAGLVQGYFEAAFGIDSNIDWTLNEEGDLELEVIPKRVLEIVNY